MNGRTTIDEYTQGTMLIFLLRPIDWLEDGGAVWPIETRLAKSNYFGFRCKLRQRFTE